jgi:hypothetical protein
MATYLSPAVFTNEIDISALPTNTSGIVPAFVGTAKKGPINEPVFISNAQQFVDTFGEPFAESFLGYAVLAYLEEGRTAWVSRVGVECEDGQVSDLSSICIDTTGNKESGWGRVAVFSGIDVGRIASREAGTSGFSFHDQLMTFQNFVDSDVNEVTFGPTDATITFTGSDYTGSVDDEFLLVITGAPTSGSMDGATYVVTRTSDGAEIADDTIDESSTPGTSEDITLEDGVVCQIVVTSGTLDVNDSFRFSARPDNRSFSFNVDNQDPSTVETYSITGDYATAEELADAITALSGFSGEDYTAVATDDDEIEFRTESFGYSIQLTGSEAFALEIGQSLWAYDIPRSNLIGIEPEPYDFSTSNNAAKFQIETSDGKVDFTANIAVGTDVPAATVASAIEAAGVVSGETYVKSYALTIPGGDTVLVVETAADYMLGQLSLLANGSNITSVRFADTVGFVYPYTESFRGYYDSRTTMPEGGEINEQIPLSCELFAAGDTSQAANCVVDSAYYSNIVGWFVAPSPGTWVDGYTISVSRFEGDNAEAGRFTVEVTDNQDVLQLRLDNVSFNSTDTSNYIANLINPGTTGGGIDGNEYINWIEREDFLQTDGYREPAAFSNREFDGQADGIPANAVYSSELDRVVIGNPVFNTGIYAFSDPEKYDISLLLTPGFSSGSVVQAGISLATQRTDTLYIVDPPFGLNAQQVVDWHNGLLLTDLQVALDSSYGALYHPWVKIYDQFNGVEIYTPPSGHVAGVFARTEREEEIWSAPAGFNRGKLSQAIGLEIDHTRGERDLMYGFNNAVNPISNFPQRGVHIWGQRTLQRLDSALDRINVRMLLIAIKKALSGSSGILNNYIFEPNDETTRRLVTSVIEGYMGDVQARRGVTGYKVICDSTNNTAVRIDRNELHVALLIKPTKVSEFIVLNIGILRTDQSFSSEEVLASVGITG